MIFDTRSLRDGGIRSFGANWINEGKFLNFWWYLDMILIKIMKFLFRLDAKYNQYFNSYLWLFLPGIQGGSPIGFIKVLSVNSNYHWKFVPP